MTLLSAAPKAPFCTNCGARCDMVPNGKFSAETGEPVLVPRCPTGKCECTGHYHDFRMRSWWQWFAPMRCTKCGEDLGGWD